MPHAFRNESGLRRSFKPACRPSADQIEKSCSRVRRRWSAEERQQRQADINSSPQRPRRYRIDLALTRRQTDPLTLAQVRFLQFLAESID